MAGDAAGEERRINFRGDGAGDVGLELVADHDRPTAAAALEGEVEERPVRLAESLEAEAEPGKAALEGGLEQHRRGPGGEAEAYGAAVVDNVRVGKDEARWAPLLDEAEQSGDGRVEGAEERVAGVVADDDGVVLAVLGAVLDDAAGAPHVLDRIGGTQDQAAGAGEALAGEVGRDEHAGADDLIDVDGQAHAAQPGRGGLRQPRGIVGDHQVALAGGAHRLEELGGPGHRPARVDQDPVSVQEQELIPIDQLSGGDRTRR